MQNYPIVNESEETTERSALIPKSKAKDRYRYAFKSVFSMSLPITINMLVASFTKFGEASMLSTFGSNQLAAGALISTSSAFLVATASSALDALNPLLGKKANQPGKDTSVGKIYRQSLIYGALFSLPLVALTFSANYIFSLLPIPEAVVNNTTGYFRLYAFALPAVMFNNSNIQLLLAANKKRWLIPISILRAILELGSSGVFMFILFNHADMATTGLGIACLAQPWITASLLSILIGNHPDLRKYELFKNNFQNSLKYLKKLTKLGLPIALQTGSELLSRVVAVWLAGINGTPSLSVYQIALQFSTFITMPTLATGTAVAIQTGIEAGKRKLTQHLRPLCVSGEILGFLGAIPVIILMASIPHQLSKIFLHADAKTNEQILVLTQKVLPIVSTSACIFGVRDIFSGGLRGLKETLSPAIISIVTSWLFGVLGGYLLQEYAGLGVEGMTIGLLAGAALGALGVSLAWTRKTGQYLSTHTTTGFFHGDDSISADNQQQPDTIQAAQLNT